MKTNETVSHRKASCRLHVLSSDGTPSANTTIQYQQTRHEFLFGCGAFDSLAYVNETDPEKRKACKDRVDKWLALYNYGTLPFYWGQFEKTEGHPETESRKKAAEFLKEHRVAVKGHPLCWHTVCADWLMNYDNETILQKQLGRIHKDVGDFKGLIDMWDVINEVVIMPVFDKYDNAITRICKDTGRVHLIKEVFAAAKEENPNATLLLNDFNTSQAYEILIDGCLEAGVPISAIGIQSHQHQGYWGLEKLQAVLERFEHFGLPIHFTENTLLSGDFLVPSDLDDLNDFHATDWPSTPAGEERQMKQMEEMYRTLFEHPLVEAITGWDFTDGAWLNAPSGVLRKDNSVKPSYEMLKNLIKGEWWSQGEIRTDENGYAVLEGFKGDYELTLGQTKINCTLTADSMPVQEITY